MSKTARISSVISSRYAQALLDLAQERKVLEQIELDLQDLLAMLESSKDFSAFLSSPVIKTVDQIKALRELSKKGQWNEVTTNFLCVLAQNNRLAALGPIIDAFYKELRTRRGQIIVDIEVAQDLDKTQRKQLGESLAKATGSEIFLNVQIKPEILGGIVVTVGSQRIDDSVKGKLERLAVNMSKPSNENEVSANQNVERI